MSCILYSLIKLYGGRGGGGGGGGGIRLALITVIMIYVVQVSSIAPKILNLLEQATMHVGNS